ncbi:hypothetical protein AAMO2058_001123300 [Amorphochlora amoebiformis]
MEEYGLRTDLKTLREQLDAVDGGLQLDPTNQGLMEMKEQLTQAVKIMEGRILDMRKAHLLQLFQAPEAAAQPPLPSPAASESVHDLNSGSAGRVCEAYTLSGVGEILTTDSWRQGSTCESVYRMMDGKGFWLISRIIDRKDENFLVLIMTPKEAQSAPCEFFLNSTCRYGDAGCKKSHGYWRKRSEIRPISSSIADSKIGDECLAKYSEDGLWYPAILKGLDRAPKSYTVKFVGYNGMVEILAEDVVAAPQEIVHERDDADEEAKAFIMASEASEEARQEKGREESSDSEGFEKDFAFKVKIYASIVDFAFRVRYKRGEPLGNEKGRKRLVHPIVPKFVVPGRSLDYAHDHTQFHRDKYRNMTKNMTQGGKDVVEREIPEDDNGSRVFSIINSAGRATSSSSEPSGKPVKKANTIKNTRRELMDVMDQKRHWEGKLRQYAKSLVRNSHGALNSDFRTKHENARLELEALKRRERQLSDGLKMRKRRKNAFKF